MSGRGSGSAEGRLHARPRTSLDVAVPGPPGLPGLHPLGIGQDRDGVVYVPESVVSGRPAPLALMLHGAGGNARHGLDLLIAEADERGVIVVSVDSRGPTWDVIRGGYGPDVAFIDRVLAHVFDRHQVDAGHLAIGGFSDGASYALSLGMTNGELFSHVVAFSPGFTAPADRVGRPRVFVSHGVHDRVLPIDSCSRRIVPAMRRAGYDVHYTEFDGPHTVPPGITAEAMDWFEGSSTA